MVSTDTIFQNVHSEIRKENLLVLKDIPSALRDELRLTDNFLYGLSKVGKINLKHLYYEKENKIHPFCYYDKFFYFGFMSLSKETIDRYKNHPEFSDLKIFKERRDYVKGLLAEGDYESYFIHTDKRIRLTMYKKLFNDIPDELKVEIFRSVYTSSEVGFDMLKPNFIKQIYSCKTDEIDSSLWETAEVTEDGYVMIYRGYNGLNTPLEKAYSWTIDKKVAEWFAERFQNEGNGRELITAKVRKENILDYLPNRNEEEVLVLPEDVIIVQREKI